MTPITVTMPNSSSQVQANITAIMTAIQPILVPAQTVLVIVILAVGIWVIGKAARKREHKTAAFEALGVVIALFMVLNPPFVINLLFKLASLF